MKPKHLYRNEATYLRALKCSKEHHARKLLGPGTWLTPDHWVNDWITGDLYLEDAPDFSYLDGGGNR